MEVIFLEGVFRKSKQRRNFALFSWERGTLLQYLLYPSYERRMSKGYWTWGSDTFNSWVTALFDENYLATAQAINRISSLAELFFLEDFADGQISSSTTKPSKLKMANVSPVIIIFLNVFFSFFFFSFVFNGLIHVGPGETTARSPWVTTITGWK